MRWDGVGWGWDEDGVGWEWDVLVFPCSSISGRFREMHVKCSLPPSLPKPYEPLCHPSCRGDPKSQQRPVPSEVTKRN